MQRAGSLEKTLMLGKIEGRRMGRQRMRWLDGITGSMDMGGWTPGVGDGQGGLACCGSWGPKSRTQLSNWTVLNWTPHYSLKKSNNFIIVLASVDVLMFTEPHSPVKQDPLKILLVISSLYLHNHQANIRSQLRMIYLNKKSQRTLNTFTYSHDAHVGTERLPLCVSLAPWISGPSLEEA